MRNFFSRGRILVLALCAFSGCSNLGKSYSQIDPEGALADIRKNNGYFSLQSVTAGTAKLVMRSEGRAANVAFSINTSDSDCNFQALGTASYSGRGVIYPWIADLIESTRFGEKSKGFLSKDLVPGQSVLIRGDGSWTEGGAVSTTYGECGPLFSKFTPAVGHAYLVRFGWEGKKCTQQVFDATDPDAPVPVPVEAAPVEVTLACPKP